VRRLPIVVVLVAVVLLLFLWLRPERNGAGRGASAGGGAMVGDDPRDHSQTGGERSRPPGTRVLRMSNKPAVKWDPGAGDYDPVTYALLDAEPAELFASEARDSVWAPAVERRIVAQLDRDLAILFPDAEVDSVECRTSSCAVSVVADPEQIDAIGEYLVAPPLGSVSSNTRQLLEDGRSELTVHVLMARSYRDDYASWHARERGVVLDRLQELQGLEPETIARLRESTVAP